MLEVQLHTLLLHLTTFSCCICALHQQLKLIGLCLLLRLLLTGKGLKLPISSCQSPSGALGPSFPLTSENPPKLACARTVLQGPLLTDATIQKAASPYGYQSSYNQGGGSILGGSSSPGPSPYGGVSSTPGAYGAGPSYAGGSGYGSSGYGGAGSPQGLNTGGAAYGGGGAGGGYGGYAGGMGGGAAIPKPAAATTAPFVAGQDACSCSDHFKSFSVWEPNTCWVFRSAQRSFLRKGEYAAARWPADPQHLWRLLTGIKQKRVNRSQPKPAGRPPSYLTATRSAEFDLILHSAATYYVRALLLANKSVVAF
eukprot:1148536-Pelagomonas_calceolata.AAC.2